MASDIKISSKKYLNKSCKFMQILLNKLDKTIFVILQTRKNKIQHNNSIKIKMKRQTNRKKKTKKYILGEFPLNKKLNNLWRN